MDGTSIEIAGSTATVVIHTLTNDIKGEIRARLAAFCYGAVRATEDNDFYSFEATVHQFMERFASKSDSTQVGMIGELLVHLAHPLAHPALASASVYFNKEERSIKKGFDLTFYQGDDASLIWYGEVKSGEVANDVTADLKSTELLRHAATDIHEKLTKDTRRSMWESAMIDAGLTLATEDAETVKKLLRSDASALNSGEMIERRALIASAVLHDDVHCVISSGGTTAVASSISSDGRFTDVRVLAVQHPSRDLIVEFFSTELASARPS